MSPLSELNKSVALLFIQLVVTVCALPKIHSVQIDGKSVFVHISLQQRLSLFTVLLINEVGNEKNI